MTTHDQIPSPPESTARLRAPEKRQSARATGAIVNAADRSEHQRALLRKQPWGRLLAQLTAIALKRTGGRSLEDAEDLAQGAIADAYRSLESGGWDPEKAPLENYLVARVIGASSNERRRKRNVCEVWLDEEAEDAPGLSVHEKHLADDAPAPEEALARLRFAQTFHDRLVAYVADDEIAGALIPLMKEGLSTPRELRVATRRSIEEAKDARRRIRYHADRITKELSAENVVPIGRARSKEVTQ
jgi:DNA-directed RNA polymerase specialized sigma24 family protein